MDVDALLKERGSRYGEFGQHARITQAMKKAMRIGHDDAYNNLPDYMKETLDMVYHKIGGS